MEFKTNLFWMIEIVTVTAKKYKDGFTVYVNNPTYERTYNGTWDKKTKTFTLEIVKGFGEGIVRNFNVREFKNWCSDQMTQGKGDFNIGPIDEEVA